MNTTRPRIAVHGSSTAPASSAEYRLAVQLGARLATAGAGVRSTGS